MNNNDENEGSTIKTTSTNENIDLDSNSILSEPKTPNTIIENPTFPEEMPIREYK